MVPPVATTVTPAMVHATTLLSAYQPDKRSHTEEVSTADVVEDMADQHAAKCVGRRDRGTSSARSCAM